MAFFPRKNSHAHAASFTVGNPVSVYSLVCSAVAVLLKRETKQLMFRVVRKAQITDGVSAKFIPVTHVSANMQFTLLD